MVKGADASVRAPGSRHPCGGRTRRPRTTFLFLKELSQRIHLGQIP